MKACKDMTGQYNYKWKPELPEPIPWYILHIHIEISSRIKVNTGFQLHICNSCALQQELCMIHSWKKKPYLPDTDPLCSLKQPVLIPFPLSQLCCDWLSLANRMFSQQVGGSSVLTSRALTQK